MECLKVEIFKNHDKFYHYSVWNNKHFLGQIIEDDILKVLDNKQIRDFYKNDINTFDVDKNKLKEIIKEPKQWKQ